MLYSHLVRSVQVNYESPSRSRGAFAFSINLEEDEIIDSAWVKVSELVKADDDKLRDSNAIKQIANCLVKKITIPLVYSINKLNKSPCSTGANL